MRALPKVPLFALFVGLSFSTPASSASPLQLEAKIPLGAVAGRIDHLAYDPQSQLLFVAELGNNSVGIVDLKPGKLVGRLQAMNEPQGVAYHAGSRTLYVANGGDGSVHLHKFDPGKAYFPKVAEIALGKDADNIRLDFWRDRIVVGYGKGALAMLDPASRKKIGEIRLDGHPESFQFDEEGQRIFVNVPDARQVAVVNVAQGKQTSTLELDDARANFPMAIDGEAHHLLLATRHPARLTAFSTQTGARLASFATCEDSDDLFVDARRQRLYVICGEGAIEVFGRHGETYQWIDRVATVPGARTGLFLTGSDRLYVAVREYGTQPAAVWVFRPEP